VKHRGASNREVDDAVRCMVGGVVLITGDDDEVFFTRNIDITTIEQNLQW